MGSRHYLRKRRKVDFRLTKKNGDGRDWIKTGQCDKKASQNNNDDVRSPPSKSWYIKLNSIIKAKKSWAYLTKKESRWTTTDSKRYWRRPNSATDCITKDKAPPDKKENQQVPTTKKTGEVQILLERIQPDDHNLRNEQYAEAHTFEESESVTFFTKKYYNVAIIFVLTSSRMNSMQFVFDTGSGANLLQWNPNKPNWQPPIRLCDGLWPKNPTKQRVELVGTIVLNVRTGERRTRVIFEILSKLAVSMLLGPSFIDNCINRIFGTERRIVLFNIAPVPTLRVYGVETYNTGDQRTENVIDVMAWQEREKELVWVTRTVRIQPLY